MNWFKKLRRNKKTTEELFLEKQERMRKHLRMMHSPGIARWCFTCGWFIMRTEKPRNRMCRCPTDLLHFRGNECLGWKLEERKASVVA